MKLFENAHFTNANEKWIQLPHSIGDLIFIHKVYSFLKDADDKHWGLWKQLTNQYWQNTNSLPFPNKTTLLVSKPSKDTLTAFRWKGNMSFGFS